MVHLEQFPDRFLNGFLDELGFGGGCGSGGKVMHLEQFSDRFLNGFFKLYELRRYLENVDRLLAEHPTPHPNWESRPGTPLVIFLGVW